MMYFLVMPGNPMEAQVELITDSDYIIAVPDDYIITREALMNAGDDTKLTVIPLLEQIKVDGYDPLDEQKHRYYEEN